MARPMPGAGDPIRLGEQRALAPGGRVRGQDLRGIRQAGGCHGGAGLLLPPLPLPPSLHACALACCNFNLPGGAMRLIGFRFFFGVRHADAKG